MIDGVLLATPAALLAFVPALLVVVLRVLQDRRRPALRVSVVAPMKALRPTPWARLRHLPAVLGALSLVGIVLALARPQASKATARDVSVEGIDIVVALDLSTSMLAEDFKPKNRFFVAKEVLKEFIQGRPSDRIGLVVFAADAYTQCPLTLDHSVLQTIIDQLALGVIDDGTAIGNGLATAVNRLRGSEAKSKVVILITDGDNNAGNVSPLQAAQMAKSTGARVYTVMVGKGGRVPFPAQDQFGRRVLVEQEIPTNPMLLKAIAKEAGGAFYLAADREELKRSLMDILDSLEKSRLFEAGAYARHDELFAWVLWPALAFALLDFTLRATRLRRFP